MGTVSDLAQRYRVLLNSILRFGVEASRLFQEMITQPEGDDNILRLKLKNAELSSKQQELEKMLLSASKGLILIVDLKEMKAVKELYQASLKEHNEIKDKVDTLISEISSKTNELQQLL